MLGVIDDWTVPDSVENDHLLAYHGQIHARQTEYKAAEILYATTYTLNDSLFITPVRTL